MQTDPNMSHVVGHQLWVEQLGRLSQSIEQLSDTNPSNISEHFFSKAIEQDFPIESDIFKSKVKAMMLTAVQQPLTTSIRECAVSIVAAHYPITFLSPIRLADIRNLAVFQVYCKCGVTVDTYFERFSSPPGTVAENTEYAEIAHGNAVCNAESTKALSDVLQYIQYIKRVLLIQQCLKTKDFKTTSYNLNWIGTMWLAHIKEQNLSLLIWELFLDLYHYKAATMSLR